MSEFESMRNKHRKDSMKITSFLIFMMLIYIFDDYFISIYMGIVQNPKSVVVLLDNNWLEFFGLIISPFVSYYIGLMTIAKRDFYYDIDNFIFKRRNKIDKLICKKMIDFKIDLNPYYENKLKELNNKIEKNGRLNFLMEIFYKYIEKDDIVNPELKTQAFIYWGDYFSKITFVILNALFFIIAIYISIASSSFSNLRLTILIIILLITIYNIRGIFFGKTANKLTDIPKTQIKQIHSNPKIEKKLFEELRSVDFGIDNE